MKYLLGLLSAAAAVLFYKNANMTQPPSVGMVAPAFNLHDAQGVAHQLADYKGQWVVVYFYPKDDTPGCTKEACQLRDRHSEFEKQDVQVLGISLDDANAHTAFIQKYQLNFPLLSDPNGEVAERYGALWHLGVTKMARRYTFLIDPNGKIAKQYLNVEPAQHAGELLADIKTLSVEST